MNESVVRKDVLVPCLTASRRQGFQSRALDRSIRCFGFLLDESVVRKDVLVPCEQFRTYLLSNLNGETPANYFSRFKRVVEAATKNGYFKRSPASDLASIAKSNKKVKEILEADEYALH